MNKNNFRQTALVSVWSRRVLVLSGGISPQSPAKAEPPCASVINQGRCSMQKAGGSKHNRLHARI